MSDVFYVGDYGFDIELDLKHEDGSAFDISTATTKQIIFIKPDGTKLTVDASFVTNGIDGKLVYSVSTNVLNMAGRWKVMAVVYSAAFWRSSSQSWFQVKNT